MYRFSIVFLMTFLIAGCTTPVSHTASQMTAYDKDTEFVIDERPDGFTLTISYSRYQFIPESNSLSVACKSALTALAWEIAEKKGKKIRPLNEQRIRLSLGRNGLTGITSCQANAIVEWTD